MTKFTGVLLILVFFLTGLSSSQAEDLELYQPPAQIVPTLADLLLVRALALPVATATTSLFVATLPVTYPLGQDQQVSEILVHKPWTYTTDRSLGVFIPPKSITAKIDEKVSEQYRDYFVQVGADRSPLTLK